MAAKLRDAFHVREVFYPSNVLTYARLLLLPLTLRALWRPGERDKHCCLCW